MPGKLDEISQAIGALQAGVGNLVDATKRIEDSIADNRTVQSTRHGENRRDIEALQRDVKDQGRKIDEQGKLITALAPQVAALQLGRGKLAALALVGFLALTILSWAVEAGFQWLVGYVLKIKFGG